MKKVFVFGAMFVISLVSFAQPLVLASATMEVSDARFSFETLQSSFVVLASSDGDNPTDIFVDYGAESVFLKINNSSTDANGCVTFYAGLVENEGVNGHRFNIVLESDYGCRSNRPWRATVREGYGWCGTMDSTMTLFGYPEWK